MTSNTNPDWINPSTNKNNNCRLDFGHLGGTAVFGDPDSWYPELWTWLIQEFELKSVLDVGCGVGIAQEFFSKNGLDTFGIDAQQVLERHRMKNLTNGHDLTLEPYVGFPKDLVWCCEVAEHIEEKFVGNVIHTLSENTGKVLALCAAPVGAGGYHHVNCKNPDYWIEKLEAVGLQHSVKLTNKAKSLCQENYGRGPRNYFSRSGLIFTRTEKQYEQLFV